MAGRSSTIVCKPQVLFSQRLTDPTLRRLTVAQLRKKARTARLDVSRLTEKWEFVHVLIQERTDGTQAHIENVTDIKRRTIFDLPGEIRNRIYSYVLVHENPIVAKYGHMSLDDCRNSCEESSDMLAYVLGPELWRQYFRAQAEPLAIYQLRNMSWANRKLRKEGRGFFFSQNSFEVKGSNVASHANFLSDIGADGRANVAVLNLDGSNFCMYDTGFLLVLRECIHLCDLSIRMHVGHILTDDTYTAIREYVTGKNVKWKDNECKVEERSLINIFTILPALQTVSLMCAIPAWHCPYDYANPLGWSAALDVVHTRIRDEVETKVSDAVLNEVEKVLEGRNVSVKVNTMRGAPELSSDREAGQDSIRNQ